MTNQKLRVLVTGGTGLVGSAIKRTVKHNEDLYENFEFKFIGSKIADLTDYEQIKKIFETFKPNYVIHLAAKVGGLFSNLSNNLEFFRVNCQINDNLLRLAYEFKVKKCISCMSTCIFPDKTTYPINETMLHNGQPHPSNFGYSYAKRMIDILNHAYDDKLNKDYVDDLQNKPIFTSVIPTNVYGFNDVYNLKDSHVIAGLTHKAYLVGKKALEDNLKVAKLSVCGTGKSLRQFIYSDDLAKLILWTMLNYNSIEPIILSVHEKDEVSIGYVAKLIADSISNELEIKFEIVFDDKYSDGQFKKTADNTKLKNLYGDFKFISIEEGINKSVKWFCENYETCRK